MNLRLRIGRDFNCPIKPILSVDGNQALHQTEQSRPIVFIELVAVERQILELDKTGQIVGAFVCRAQIVGRERESFEAISDAP